MEWGRVSGPYWIRWRACRIDSPELEEQPEIAMYCPACARRQFGLPRHCPLEERRRQPRDGSEAPSAPADSEDVSAQNRANGQLGAPLGRGYLRLMSAALLLTGVSPSSSATFRRTASSSCRRGGSISCSPATSTASTVGRAGAGDRDRTGQADAVDRIHAFRRGCDDYVPRPFDYQELVERIRAVLRGAAGRADVVEPPPVRIECAPGSPASPAGGPARAEGVRAAGEARARA